MSQKDRNYFYRPALSKTFIKVGAIALLWIAVVSSGRLGTGDTILRWNMSHAWWTGTPEVPVDYQPTSREDLKTGVIGKDGKRRIAYDPGQSLLMIPGDWLGSKLHPLFPQIGNTDFRQLIVYITIFIPLNVVAVLSCFWLLELFNFEERLAGIASIIWLIGTTVLPYAQVPFQNNQVLLCVTVGYATVLAFLQTKRFYWLIFSGLALGAAVLLRLDSVFHVLTVLLFLVGCIAYESRDKIQVFKTSAIWISGWIPLIFLGRIIDYFRYGSFWAHGQSMWMKQVTTSSNSAVSSQIGLPTEHFNSNVLTGIWGVLFSPAKSIFIYDPLLLPCLILTIVLWKKLSPYMQWYLLSVVLNLCLFIAFTSRLPFWHGDSAWAARYHLTSLHLLLIPLVALFVRYLLSAKRSTRWLMRSILAIAICVQMASTVMFFSLEDAQSRLLPEKDRFVQFRLGQRLQNIICSIDSSFSSQCPSRVAARLSPDKRRFLNYHDRIVLLPFNFTRYGLNRKWTFIFWGSCLTAAMVTTIVWLNSLGSRSG